MMMINKLKIIVILSGIIFINSCGIYQKYNREDNYIDKSILGDVKILDTISLIVPWQEFYKDDNLKNIIELGLNNNINLNIAKLRIDRKSVV